MCGQHIIIGGGVQGTKRGILVYIGGLHDGDKWLAYSWKVRFLFNQLSFLFCYMLMDRLDGFVLQMNKHF